MSAAVCGSKRSFFEDIPSPPVSKRIRCSSTSPIRLSPPSLLDQLRSIFPLIELQILERALEECGNDLDLAIKSLNDLHFASAEGKSGSAEEFGAKGVKGGRQAKKKDKELKN
ncbi:uncharacterized protein LOC110808771, partial [Carica papaya]|uniref:uncharacterized protein LOC110808771 n=1 Tax=Carica papaya TaxID=3649 RepID=UPI000B8CBDEB